MAEQFQLDQGSPDESPEHGQAPPTQNQIITRIIDMFKNPICYIGIAIAVLVLIGAVVWVFVIEKDVNIEHTSDTSNFWNDEMSDEQQVWFDSGLKELRTALNVERNTRRAKNVILFVGDGMGVNTATASRIYKYGEGGRLSWEEFPHTGMLKVSMTEDSAAICNKLPTK